jgi:hypothetical protein
MVASQPSGALLVKAVCVGDVVETGRSGPQVAVGVVDESGGGEDCQCVVSRAGTDGCGGEGIGGGGEPVAGDEFVDAAAVQAQDGPGGMDGFDPRAP